MPSPETRMIEMIFPEHANHYGTLFGGNALAMLAKAAFVAATRHVGLPVVMARSDRVDFTTPVRVGEVLELIAQVVRTGRSSMTVEVRAETGNRTVLRGSFEMVAVDGNGRPVAINDNPRKETTHEPA